MTTDTYETSQHECVLTALATLSDDTAAMILPDGSDGADLLPMVRRKFDNGWTIRDLCRLLEMQEMLFAVLAAKPENIRRAAACKEARPLIEEATGTSGHGGALLRA